MIRETGTRSAQQIKDEAYEWYLLLHGSEATSEDRSAFEQWRVADPRHDDAYDRAATVWTALGNLDTKDLDPDVARRPAVDRTMEWLARRLDQLSFAPRWQVLAGGGGVAFVVSAIVLAWWAAGGRTPEVMNPPRVADYATDVGETRSVTLADGTVATLGAATRLRTEISAGERRIFLSRGAAIFEVFPDSGRPFSVAAGMVTATALGTLFEVRMNGDVVRVAVDEGRVEVAKPFMIGGRASSMLTRNELAAGQFITAVEALNADPVAALDEAAFGAWRDDRLDYVGATLRELIADANRYSKRRIVVEGDTAAFDGMRVTAFFDGKDIDSMLALLPSLFSVTVDTAAAQDIVVRPASQ